MVVIMKRNLICIVLLAVTLLVLSAFPISAADEATENFGVRRTALSTAIGQMDLSPEGLDLIKNFEGYAQYPYSDYSHWSIGYGSYVCSLDDDPYKIYPNGISIVEAEEMLLKTVGSYINSVNKFALEYNLSLTQNQFDALVSFTYNLGANIWKRSTSSFTIKRLLISGEYTAQQMEDAFYMWRNAGGKENAGLARRRLREAKLFNSDINMSDPSSSGYDVKYYIVNTNLLTVRSEASALSTSLGSIRRNTVIPILYTDESTGMGFTTYAAFYGWVATKDLIGIEEKSTVSVANEDGIDSQGVYYAFDHINMTATVGSNDAAADNNSKYAGLNSGYVYLTKYILYDGRVYTLTSIGEKAFSQCDYLKRIYIPSSVTAIADSAFEGSKLTDIYYQGGSYAEQYAKSSPYKATNYSCIVSHTYGNWQMVSQGSDESLLIEESVCSVCGDVRQRKSVAIEILVMPAKIEYYEGDPFDPSGIKVVAVFDDGAQTDITSSVSYSGFDSSTLGAKDITVTYGSLAVSFKIRVNEKQLVGISIEKTPKVTTFIEGTKADYTGLQVVAKYDNNSSEVVNEYELSKCDMNTVGKQTITVTYNGFKAFFSVTIKAKSVTSVIITSDPYKTEYYCGESFAVDGLTMRVSYDNGTEETVEEGFRVTGFDSSKPGNNTVRVYYGGKYKSLNVLIILNSFVSEEYGIDNDERCRIKEKTTVADFISAFEASDRIEVLGIDKKALSKDSYVGSGCTAVLWYNEDRLAQLDIAVGGDLNGDGYVTLGDYLMMSLLFTSRVDEYDTMVQDINNDGQVTLADLVCLLSKIKLNNEDEQPL